MFQLRHHNRLTFPTKHILIAEDDISNQLKFIDHLNCLFDPQGHVRISLVAGGASAAAILNTEPVDLLILDFDMPYGNAPDLISWMVTSGKKVPIITASGWEPNNLVFEDILSKTDIWYKIFTKQQVFDGIADVHILEFVK